MGIILEKKKQYEQPKHPPLFDLGPPLTNYSKCFIQQLIKYQNMFQFFCLISFILMSNLWVLYQRRKNKTSNQNALLSLTWGNLFLSLLKLHSITDQISKYQTEKPKAKPIWSVVEWSLSTLRERWPQGKEMIKYQNMFWLLGLISFILMSNLWVLY